MMIKRLHDRLDTWVFGPWWFRVVWTTKPFAYVVRIFRHKVAFRPIDYAKAGAVYD